MAVNKYTLIWQTYGAAQLLDLGGCNSVTFFNTGTGTAFIEGCPIPPGASLQISGNECEVTFDVLQITFDLTAGLVQSLTVIKKVFTSGFTQTGY
jgi:hypothetical protein